MAVKNELNNGADPGRPVSVLVVMVPGRLRDSLLALLHSLPGVQQVCQAEGAAAARAMVAREAPALLILDWDLWSEEAEALLQEASARRPRSYCVSVVSSEGQRVSAWKFGSDAVLVRGFSLHELEAVVQRCAAPVSSQPA